MTRFPIPYNPCIRWMGMANTNTARSSHAPRIAVRGMSRRMHPAISPTPSTIRTNPGMWVVAKSSAALGITNSTASIRMTTPKAHCRTVNPSLVCEALIDLSLCLSLAWRFGFDLFQTVAGARIQVELVKLLQVANAFQRCGTEGSLAVKGVQHNPLKHITQRHVVIFRECFQYFQNSLLNAHSGLYSLDFQSWIVGHVYQCTTVPNTFATWASE